MLSEDQLRSIADKQEASASEIALMAQEILRYRQALAEPWAIVEPLGVKYVEDGNAAIIWPARYRERHDISLYRLDITEA